jgi:hypothetical protein
VVTAAGGQLAGDWTQARRKLGKAIRRADRDRYDSLVLGLLAVAQRGQLPADRLAAERHRGLLRVGVATATALVRYAPADLELLAAAAVLPWFDDALLGSRARLLSAAGPLDWTQAMVLAMVPAAARSMRAASSGDRSGYVHQLAALPPLLRAAVLLERQFAAGVPEVARLAFASAWPFDSTELAVLAPGLPADLLPPAGPPPAGLVGAPALPVGSPAEAVALVRENLSQPIGGYRLMVDGDPAYRVDGRELVYQVRWDVPAGAIRQLGRPVSYPGDDDPSPPREPGWLVDRVSREVHPVDLSIGELASYASARRVFPLPPGWQPDARPPLPDGFGAQLAALLPASVAASIVPEATVRYAGRLLAEDWPDYLVALRVAGYTAQALAGAGLSEPDLRTAAVLAAHGPGPGDTLLDEASAHWQTPAGELARAAVPAGDELDGPGAIRRAERLAGAPAPVRALVIANARGRGAVEQEQFGVLPLARREELSALATLTPGLPVG